MEIEAHAWVNLQEAYLHPEDAPEGKANMLTQFPRIVSAAFLFFEFVVIHSRSRLSSLLLKSVSASPVCVTAENSAETPHEVKE